MTFRSYTAPWCAAGLLGLLVACGSGGGGDPAAEDSGGLQVGPVDAGAGESDARQSTNWSGYVQTGLPDSFRRISGSWTVPAVQCPGSGSTASSTWTGIGGGDSSDPTLIQAGTEQSCSEGAAAYSAWWELIPAPAITAGEGLLDAQDYPVHPGDRITVSIDGSSALVWAIEIRNSTRDWIFNITAPYTAAGATAEWVQEAPLSVGSDGAGQTTLSDYGRVAFDSLSVNGANPALSAAERVVMVDADGEIISNPSAPAAGGDAFDVCYGAGACR